MTVKGFWERFLEDFSDFDRSKNDQKTRQSIGQNWAFDLNLNCKIAFCFCFLIAFSKNNRQVTSSLRQVKPVWPPRETLPGGSLTSYLTTILSNAKIRVEIHTSYAHQEDSNGWSHTG